MPKFIILFVNFIIFFLGLHACLLASLFGNMLFLNFFLGGKQFFSWPFWEHYSFSFLFWNMFFKNFVLELLSLKIRWKILFVNHFCRVFLYSNMKVLLVNLLRDLAWLESPIPTRVRLHVMKTLLYRLFEVVNFVSSGLFSLENFVLS